MKTLTHTKKFKKGDTVRVTAGRDKGMTGKIVRVFHKTLTAIVEGAGLYKRHVKATQNSAGGIKSVERPLSLSKIALIEDGKVVRVGLSRTKDVTTRISKKTGKSL